MHARTSLIELEGLGCDSKCGGQQNRSGWRLSVPLAANGKMDLFFVSPGSHAFEIAISLLLNHKHFAIGSLRNSSLEHIGPSPLTHPASAACPLG
jgi:hypothetical protein